MSTKMKPLSTADFGKVMKQVYPCVKPRRLGTRGNSRYCYAGMRKRVKLEVPQLPDLGEKQKTIEIPTVQNDLLIAASQLIREWAEKLLGINFVNLRDLAQHLIDKSCVDSTSAAAHMLMSSSAEAEGQEAGDSKAQYSQQSKSNQRGVIKQLKRKIQSQPQSSPGKGCRTGKKTKSTNLSEPDQDVANEPQATQTEATSDMPIKVEGEVPVAGYPRLPHESPMPRKDFPHKLADPPPDMMSPSLHSFNSDVPREYPRAHAVNLASPYNTKQQYLPPDLIRSYKSVQYPPRHPEYHDSYKYNMYYPPPDMDTQQPRNLSISSYVSSIPAHQYASEMGSQFPPSNSNLPINLSNNGSEDFQKSYKASQAIKGYEAPPNIVVHAPQYESDSLNLSLVNRREWQPQPPPLQHNPPAKLPLPGKKMILEAYNNENMINSPQSYYGDHSGIVKPTVSPGKIAEAMNRGEYLPKKMRATESFGGKLSSARIANNTADLQSKEPDKYNRIEAVIEPAVEPQKPQNFVPSLNIDVNLNTERASLGSGDTGIMNNPSISYPPQDYLSPSGSGGCFPIRETRNLTVEADIPVKESKKAQKHSRVSKKDINTKSPDSTNSNTAQNVVPKPVARGRPRKKSLSKAKYTRRQPKAPARAQCDHSKHPKRSSDSCCSLTEAINIKTGIICAEKHSEILNRERVISICNMDKHALDDYLNEGNSQENEEELMQYFQQNSDSQSNDGNLKDTQPGEDCSMDEQKDITEVNKIDISDNIEPTEDSISSTSAVTTNLSSLHETSTQGSDFLDSNLDVHEDHSQSKIDKISQLRELLQRNLRNSSSLPSGQENCAESSSSKHPNIPGVVGNLIQQTGEIESAFTSITRRGNIASNTTVEYKEGSASASLSMLSQRQQNKVTDRPNPIHAPLLLNRGLTARRRVSFETPIPDSNLGNCYGNQDSPIYNRGQHSVPQSPTSRVQNFSFMPISPGPLSPVGSNKNSPMGTYKQATSPSKVPPRGMCTSPVSQSSTASPFVSPRNTPVPRARATCNVKPVPSKLQAKRLSRGSTKGMNAVDKNHNPREALYCSMLKSFKPDVGNFVIPNDQSTVPRSPGYTTKMRNFPMSAPPSPNILTTKYKPSFVNQGQSNGSTSMLQCFLQEGPSSQPNYMMPYDNMGVHQADSAQSDQSHLLSADPLSHEVSQFFSDSAHVPINDINGSLRSQSVPLNQNIATSEANHMFFEHGRQPNTVVSNNAGFLSYNNTPCSSIPPTPVPREFCDFNLNDTCESISKAGLDSENLHKIYNVLDSNNVETLGNRNNGNIASSLGGVKQNNGDLMMTSESIGLPGYNQDLGSNGVIIEPLLQNNMEMGTILPQNGVPLSKPGPYEDHMQNMFAAQSQNNSEYLKRSNSVEFDLSDISIENRYYVSRSVPNTPLPRRKTNLPNFDLSKTHSRQQFQEDFLNQNPGRNMVNSKSVPSTPLIPEDRTMFSYSNRDFLINGNSVDPSLGFGDKTITSSGVLEESFLERDALLEGKSNVAVLAGLDHPLPETMDMVNTGLVSFNDDCMDITSELPAFTEQGIPNESDLLGLDRMDSVSYDNVI